MGIQTKITKTFVFFVAEKYFICSFVELKCQDDSKSSNITACNQCKLHRKLKIIDFINNSCCSV